MNTRSFVLACVVCTVTLIGCDELTNSVEEEEPNRSPAVPFDPFPASGDMLEEAPTTVSWNSSDPDGDPLVYDIFFGDNPNPPQLETDYPTNVWAIPDNITPGTWYWRIVVRDDSDEQAEGPVWQFTIIAPNQPPNPPYNPNPPSGTINWDFGGELTWQCEDPDGDELVYDFYFGETGNPPLYTQSYDTFVTFGAIFDPLTTYSWKVVARDEQQAETVGPIWSFTTHGPGFPFNLYPSDNAVDVPIDVTLSWGVENPEEAQLEFDVYLSTSDPPTLLAEHVTETTYDANGLYYNAPYTWKIVARKVDGGTTNARIVPGKMRVKKAAVDKRNPKKNLQAVEEDIQSTGEPAITKNLPFPTQTWTGEEDVEGPIWHFTTFDPSGLDPYEPSNPSPYDGEAGIPPDLGSLSWTGGSPDPTAYLKYDVYLGTDSGNLPSLALTIVDTTIGYYGLLGETWYYWKVRSYDLDGDEAWSPTWSFYTGHSHLQIPEAPYNPVPFDGESDIPLSGVTLQWSCTDPDPDGDKVYYDVYMYKEGAGSPSTAELIGGDLTDPYCTIPFTLDPNSNYVWRVYSKDEFGNSNNSQWWTFTTTVPIAEISFPDANLEAAVRAATGISTGPIYTSDVDTIREFTAHNYGISDMTGIGYFLHLEKLSVDSNNISIIDPIDQLPRLQYLSAEQNIIVNINSLDDISWHMIELRLGRNMIFGYTTLLYYANLEVLVLSDNAEVIDVAFSTNLPALREVFLVNTGVTDLTPLVNNADFATGDYLNVMGCPLSADAINVQIPALQARGVYVDWDVKTPIEFADSNFETAVRTYYSLPAGTIYDVDVDEFAEFDGSYYNISDLTGIEYFTSLHKVQLGYNSIVDITPLTQLANLDTLWMSNNLVSDISALITVQSLKLLSMAGNPLTSLAGLHGLANLQSVDVSSSPISDLGPLVSNLNFATGAVLYLYSCPLSTEAINTQIPTLEARGVVVLR